MDELKKEVLRKFNIYNQLLSISIEMENEENIKLYTKDVIALERILNILDN